MLIGLKTWDPNVQIQSGEKLKVDDLTITFHRTIRVPDNIQTNNLPPSLGHFPLYQVEDYAAKLPQAMAQKGGVFFPMYQREAMWINFDSIKRYAIKIYTGTTNAISGEPLVETPATGRRRINLMRQGKSLQDFVVAPKQQWLDGTAVAPGKVRQFTAMPMGSGYSVEAQLTGEETSGGLRFEITRLDTPLKEPLQILVRGMSRGVYAVNVEKNASVDDLMDGIRATEGMPPSQRFNLIFGVKQMHEGSLLSSYHLEQNSTVTPMLRTLGGCSNPAPPAEEIVLAAGGLIKQHVRELTRRKYEKTVTVELNVQMVNSASFRSITGCSPPSTPISAATYIKNGFPFYSLYEEPTNIFGPSFGIKSIGQIDGTTEAPLKNVTVLDVATRKQLKQWSCSHCSMINIGGFQSCDSCGEMWRDAALSTTTMKMGLLNLNANLSPLRFSWDLAEDAEEAYWK